MSIISKSTKDVYAALRPIGRPTQRPKEVGRKPRRKPNPRNSWPKWTDAVAFTTDEPDGPRPTAIDPEPSPAQQAERAGLERGEAGDRHALPPSDMPAELQLSWWLGLELGLGRRSIAAFTHKYRPRPTGMNDLDVHPRGVS